MSKTLLEKFRFISFIEGVSFIVLLFIAMPLKYYFGYPIATKVIGSIHGILFIGFIVLLVQSIKEYRFSTKFGMTLFIASLLPFGTFFTDKMLRDYEIEESPVSVD